MAKPDFTTQDAATYKTNIDTEVGYLYDTGLVSATGDAILKKVDAVGTIANYFEVENAITGNPAVMRAVGTDTNVGFNWITKGSGVGLLNGDPISRFEAQIVIGLVGNTSEILTGIPSWAKIIHISGIATLGATQYVTLQLGIAGSPAFPTTGYTSFTHRIGNATATTSTNYFYMTDGAAVVQFTGTLINDYNNVWQYGGTSYNSITANNYLGIAQGHKDLGGANPLTQLKFATSGGTTLNTGSISVFCIG